MPGPHEHTKLPSVRKCSTQFTHESSCKVKVPARERIFLLSACCCPSVERTPHHNTTENPFREQYDPLVLAFCEKSPTTLAPAGANTPPVRSRARSLPSRDLRTGSLQSRTASTNGNPCPERAPRYTPERRRRRLGHAQEQEPAADLNVPSSGCFVLRHGSSSHSVI
jgi:hypothetical protein